MDARCRDCGWTMPADDEEEAAILLALHRTVKAVDAAESIVEDEAAARPAGCTFAGSLGDQVFTCVHCNASPEECADGDCCCELPGSSA